jgi:hypothetical protein
MGILSMNSAAGKKKMIKTTIELTEEQYFYLKEKALELQKKRKHYSLVSIIRDLIEEDRRINQKKVK